MNKIQISKMNLSGIILVMILSLSALNISAETTFFDNPDEVFITNNSLANETSTTVEPIAEVTNTSNGGDCLTNWICSNWGPCINKNQTRNCTKENVICYADMKTKPIEIQICPINQLLNIKFELDSLIIENSNELTSIITFTSFGSISTPVNLTYRILNSSKNEVYSEKESIKVTTERIVRKNFENLSLISGNYTLILATVYSDGVTDEFRQDFKIMEPRIGITGRVIDFVSGKGNKLYALITLGLIVVLVITTYKIRRYLKYGY